MKYDTKTKTMDYSKKETEHVHGMKLSGKKEKVARKMKSHKDGTDIPKHKWGAKQGNFMKVHPLDRY